MKKLGFLFLMLLLVFGVFVGCDVSSPDRNDDDTETTDDEAEEEETQPDPEDITHLATIDYSSISTDEYSGYTPDAQDTVDGIKKSSYNHWSASNGSGTGWISYSFESTYTITKVIIYSGYYASSNEGALQYTVQYKDSSGSWSTYEGNAWADDSNSDVSVYSSSSGDMNKHVIEKEKTGKGIKIDVTGSTYPTSHLWRTCISEVEIWGYEE